MGVKNLFFVWRNVSFALTLSITLKAIDSSDIVYSIIKFKYATLAYWFTYVYAYIYKYIDIYMLNLSFFISHLAVHGLILGIFWRTSLHFNHCLLPDFWLYVYTVFALCSLLFRNLFLCSTRTQTVPIWFDLRLNEFLICCFNQSYTEIYKVIFLLKEHNFVAFNGLGHIIEVKTKK